MGQAIIYGQTAAGGSSGGSTLTVHAEEGSTITVAKDNNVLTSTDNPAVFKKLEDGTWNATAEKEGKYPISQSIELCTNYVMNLNAKIYGISRDITAPSPHWTRTHDAVGMSATASVGTVAGESDFSNVYPWNEIYRETLSTGDVMVHIPQFYFRRYRDGNVEHIEITDRKMDDFMLHPMFDRPDRSRIEAYVGAYKTTSNNRSVSGADPQRNQTRAVMRDNARAKGTGWGIIDISALEAVRKLILTEFSTNDVQTAIGSGFTSVSSSALTGYCDNVPNLTGNPGGDTTKTDVVYRGIEGLWGNVFEWTDGLNFITGDYYICNDPTKYADDTSTGYQMLSYTGLTRSGVYITELGFDEDHPHIMLPKKASGGSATTYFCDTMYGATGWTTYARGGTYNSGTGAGLFETTCYYSSSQTAGGFGSRLLYLP